MSNFETRTNPRAITSETVGSMQKPVRNMAPYSSSSSFTSRPNPSTPTLSPPACQTARTVWAVPQAVRGRVLHALRKRPCVYGTRRKNKELGSLRRVIKGRGVQGKYLPSSYPHLQDRRSCNCLPSPHTYSRESKGLVGEDYSNEDRSGGQPLSFPSPSPR